MDIPYTVTPRRDTGLYNSKIGIWLFLSSEVMLFGALFCSYILLRTSAPVTGPLVWPLGSDYLNIPIGTFNTAVLITSSITVILSWASLVRRDVKKFKFYMGVTVICGVMFLCIKSYEYHEKFIHYGILLNDQTTVKGHLEEIVVKEKDGTEKKYSSWNGALQIVNGVVTQSTFHNDQIADRELSYVLIHKDPPIGKHHAVAKEGHAEATKIYGNQIARVSNFGPWYHPFFAIYFTLTALHALHVFGGMMVNFYLMTAGIGMFKTDPQHLTNRVEVSGLFWHFVDLVWIFLFPVLYLL